MGGRMMESHIFMMKTRMMGAFTSLEPRRLSLIWLIGKQHRIKEMPIPYLFFQLAVPLMYKGIKATDSVGNMV